MKDDPIRLLPGFRSWEEIQGFPVIEGTQFKNADQILNCGTPEIKNRTPTELGTALKFSEIVDRNRPLVSACIDLFKTTHRSNSIAPYPRVRFIRERLS